MELSFTCNYTEIMHLTHKSEGYGGYFDKTSFG
jgi:hypothetical protein